MSSESLPPAGARNQTEVFAIHGADPEVLAYAMARYSRSALSMRDSLREISGRRAEQFLNTFYFQYGHRSIADLAHIAFAVERLSLLAAIVLVDEQRWDGQERSTRYQNFLESGWYLPDLGQDAASAALYRETVEDLFRAYRRTSQAVFETLGARVARPAEMRPEAYERTLRARAFDVARYLLPLATNTSLGQIVNARTLETQISRLLSHPAAEIRDLGERLRAAASGPAWNPQAEAGHAFVERCASHPDLAGEAACLLTRPVHTAPTLVKYTAPGSYLIESRTGLAQAAGELLAGHAPAEAPLVDLVEHTESLEAEVAATLIYSASHHPYRQVRDIVTGLPGERISEIVELGLRHRGPHDELLREFHAGAALRFDILMDIGGFRDMHRHRRTTQILQGFTSRHGYETPREGDAGGLLEAGVEAELRTAVEAAHEASSRIAESTAPEARQSALYLLPLATRVRCLFKMDFAEAGYISELRSAPAGHFSYRRVAWEMYLALTRQHPTLARSIRVTDYTRPVDLLKR